MKDLSRHVRHEQNRKPHMYSNEFQKPKMIIDFSETFFIQNVLFFIPHFLEFLMTLWTCQNPWFDWFVKSPKELAPPAFIVSVLLAQGRGSPSLASQISRPHSDWDQKFRWHCYSQMAAEVWLWSFLHYQNLVNSWVELAFCLLWAACRRSLFFTLFKKVSLFILRTLSNSQSILR